MRAYNSSLQSFGLFFAMAFSRRFSLNSGVFTGILTCCIWPQLPQLNPISVNSFLAAALSEDVLGRFVTLSHHNTVRLDGIYRRKE